MNHSPAVLETAFSGAEPFTNLYYRVEPSREDPPVGIFAQSGESHELLTVLQDSVQGDLTKGFELTPHR